MIDIFTSARPRRHYLLIPSPPTPNGRLHLGHIAGPFLKLDVMARAFRMDGDIAGIMSASDVYESYVTLKAWRDGLKPEQVCEKYHALIARDMDALMIEYDGYYDPLATTERRMVADVYRQTIDQLVAAGAVEQRSERVLYSPGSQKYIVGCWLKGTCPNCGAAAGSYLCESCGQQFNPEDIRDPIPVAGETDLLQEHVSSYFLLIRDKQRLLRHVAQMGINSVFVDIGERYLTAQNDAIRLTNPGTWGVPWDDAELRGGNRHVVFPYCGLWSLARVCARQFALKHKLAVPPFDRASDVITVFSFGIDCMVPWMIGALGSAIEAGIYNPGDFLLPNYFFSLEGSKFSTSRGHAIWAEDIVRLTPASPDSVRFYLMESSPDTEPTNFSLDAFVEMNNRYLGGVLQDALNRHWADLRIQAVSPASDRVTEKFAELYQEQRRVLGPRNQTFRNTGRPLRKWIEAGRGGIHPYWFLKGFAMLSYPIMPRMATHLWAMLGETDSMPMLSRFLGVTAPLVTKEMINFFPKLSREELQPCLPRTLT